VTSVASATPFEHTEYSVLSLLRKRYSAVQGNGPEWAYVEKVRNAPGFAATRTADAMALSLWPSRGHELHGFEVKVSRSDWRTELKNGAKADAWHEIIDRWWIVAPVGVVPKDELPGTWGLLEVSRNSKTSSQTVAAPLLTTARADISRRFLVPLLRAAGCALEATPEQKALQEAEAEGWRKGHAAGVRDSGQWQRMYEDQKATSDLNRAAVNEITNALGVSITEWNEKEPKRAKDVAEALRVVLADEVAVKRSAENLERAASQLEQQAKWIREHAGKRTW
jgi:hypothetical protein